ncbi:SGNH/GDSL hydrolase family protein [Thermodesulfobacteriota bacterium]
MKKIQNALANTFIVVISMLLAFVFFEALTNIYLFYFADEGRFTRYASVQQLQERNISNKLKYSPHRYLGYYPTPKYNKGKNRHNSLGYRGDEIDMPKPKGQFRIVCLGGSTTYTVKIEDYQISYPDLLKKYLKGKGFQNVNVINAGASGWSSWESLINFELRVLDLEPDMIIVYHGINDIHSRFVWPPNAYRGDNSGRRAHQVGIIMPSILEYSTLLRALMIKMGKTTAHANFGRTIDRPPDTYYGSLFRKQTLEGVYPEGIFKEVSAEEMLKTNKPVFFERNIRNIVCIAKNMGIDVVLSSFAYSPLFIDQPRVSTQEYIAAYREHNSLLKEIARETDVNFFDFAGKFPIDKHYYTDGRHVNEKGSQLKAEFFGNYLIKKELIVFSND